MIWPNARPTLLALNVRSLPMLAPNETAYEAATRRAVRQASKTREEVLTRSALRRLEAAIRAAMERRSFGQA